MNTSELRRSVRVLSNAVIQSYEKINILSLFLLRNRDINESKEQINEYLKLCGKRVVIYIDDLDRVEEDKIIFLFKLVNNVLNFDRITYVISFDDKKIKQVFESKLNIDYGYLKKIIQMQVKVPEVDRAVMERIVKESTYNLIKSYNKKESEIREYNEFIVYISKNINDIRDFKRFLNSIVVKALKNKSGLNKTDKMAIEYIRMTNYDLYMRIYNNRQYFISEDIRYDEKAYRSVNLNNKFNSDGKKFFDCLFRDYTEYKDLLSILFPYVARYNKNDELKSRFSSTEHEEYYKIAKTKGIASAKYFDLYFSETENEFYRLGGYVENIINSFNSVKCNVSTTFEYLFEQLLKKIPVSVQREFFERIQLHLVELNEQSRYELLCVLFKNIWKINDSIAFAVLTARSRCNVIMWELIQVITDEQFEQFLALVGIQYDKIYIINCISYWFESNKDNKNTVDRDKKWKETESKMTSDIINNNINLYDDNYYHRHNIWGLYRNLRDEKCKFQAYIKEHISKQSIFRMLYDVLQSSVGTEYKYYFESGHLQDFFEEDWLKNYMDNIKPETEDKKFLYELYYKHLEYPNDEMGDDSGISFEEEKILNV